MPHVIQEQSWINTIGAPGLMIVWTDPDFDPEVPAFCYALVLEIPTPRWTASDAKHFFDFFYGFGMTTVKVRCLAGNLMQGGDVGKNSLDVQEA